MRRESGGPTNPVSDFRIRFIRINVTILRPSQFTLKIILKILPLLSRFYIGFILAFALIGRLLTLEYTDLTDPTEARYAVIAQEMVKSGHWLTPMLPMPEGVVPYLGKPPLHFWVTALSYKFFGVDEWTSRLPSLIATILLLAATFYFTTTRFDRTTGLIASLIFLSSGLVYVVCGASITDVTLTLMTTIATILLYRFVSDETVPRKVIYLSALFAGLGFLVKGPISLVLIGLPLFLLSLIRWNFVWMKKVPWFFCISIFAGVILPWFVISEIKNPGFTKYFIWNENIGRYLLEDYGDRYGSGHTRAFGMSWAYLALGFLPWTVVLPYILFRTGTSRIRSLFTSDPDALFIACWSVASPLFFTFVHQLHPVYILPAMVPLSILLAVFIARHADLLPKFNHLTSLRYFTIAIIVFSLVALLIGAIKEFSLLSPVLTFIIALATCLVFRFTITKSSALNNLAASCLVIFCLHLLVTVNLTPFMNSKNSAEKSLIAIANDNTCVDTKHADLVGVMTQNTYSHYWTAGAWKEELPRKLEIRYVPIPEIALSEVCYFLLEAKVEKSAPAALLKNFSLKYREQGWIVYARNKLNSSNI
jgi:4-amino-4-deoxy-L-arabinose transferase-like glycosyltransferase